MSKGSAIPNPTRRAPLNAVNQRCTVTREANGSYHFIGTLSAIWLMVQDLRGLQVDDAGTRATGGDGQTVTWPTRRRKPMTAEHKAKIAAGRKASAKKAKTMSAGG